jgi:hypothetical protein
MIIMKKLHLGIFGGITCVIDNPTLPFNRAHRFPLETLIGIRAPNGMGWDENFIPWDESANPIPSHGISLKIF